MKTRINAKSVYAMCISFSAPARECEAGQRTEDRGGGGGGGGGRVVGGEPADGGDRAGGSFAKVLAPPAPSRLYKGAI